jgi:predicted O-methyltransferase YrrM
MILNAIRRISKAFLAGGLDLSAFVLARFLPMFVREPFRVRYFPLWERFGLHLSPVHYYEPIPDTRTLTETIFERKSELIGIDLHESDQLNLLRSVFPQFRDEYAEIAAESRANRQGFYLNNAYFAGADALVYYAMVRHFKPRRIVEVGCGFSSLLAARACRRNGYGDLVCIDPNPGQVLEDRLLALTTLIRKPVQDLELELFKQLEANDILFIDSSHVVKCGGDVNYLLLEIVPRLNPGVIVHLHDIFLPQDYSRYWIKHRYRFFTEQYLLQAFLTFNTEFRILFANRYMTINYEHEMAALFPSSSELANTSFWMCRDRSGLTPG